MSITTTTQVAGPVNVVYQQTLLRVATPRCVYFVGSMPGTLQSHSGSFTVKWRRHDALTPTTSALSELTGSASYPTRSASQAAVTDLTSAVSKYGDFFLISEEADLVNFNGTTDAHVKTLGIQAGRSLNRLQRNVLEDNATLIYASGASADGDVADSLSLSLIENACNTIENNSAITFTSRTTGSTNTNTTPILESYWGLCHTHVKPDIRKLAGFVSVERYAGQVATAPGEFGAVGDVRWVSSPEASADADLGGDPGASSLRSTSGTAADLYTSIVFGMDAHGAISLDSELIQEIYNAGDSIPGIMVINKAKGSAGTADPLDELASMGWKAWHAGRILNGDWVRGIRHAASKLD